MLTLLLVLAPISLLDSMSMIPLCIVPLAVILGGPRPILGASSFLGGIFLVYTAGGAVLLVGLDALFDAFGPGVARWWNQPNTLELLLQIVLGAVMLGLGWKVAGVRESRAGSKPDDAISSGRGFVIGAGLTLVGLPGAFPYFGAIDQILRAELNDGSSTLALLFYNVVFVLPLATLLLVRLLLPAHSGAVFKRVADVADRWGRRFIVATLVLVGAVLVADGVGWFLGYPLLPVN